MEDDDTQQQQAGAQSAKRVRTQSGILKLKDLFFEQQNRVAEAVAAANEAARASAQMTMLMQSNGAMPPNASSVPATTLSSESVAALAAAVTSKAAPKAKCPQCYAEAIERAGRDYEKDVRKSMRSKRRLEKAKADLQFFNEDDSMTRYPPGVRPFGSCVDQLELDRCWSKAASDSYVFQVEIPQGSTRREAMRLCHRALAVHNKDVDVEALDEHCSQSRQSADKSVFKQKCVAAVSEVKRTTANDLSLEEPAGCIVHPEALEAKVEEVCKKVITKMMNEQDAADRKKPRTNMTRTNAKSNLPKQTQKF